MSVYIATRNRYAYLDKTLPMWLEQPNVGPVRLVVAPEEWEQHLRYVSDIGLRGEVEVLALSREGFIGISAIWNEICHMAIDRNEQYIITSEDDLYPKPEYDWGKLCPALEKYDSIGVGAAYSYQGLYIGNDWIKSGRVVPALGSWGFRCFALNVHLVEEMGWYDERLVVRHWEPEMQRYGVRSGRVWRVHTGVHYQSMAARFAPGGMEEFPERMKREEEAHRIVYEKWPEWTSEPGKKFRYSWRKMHDHYIPHWRNLLPKGMK